MSQMTKTVTHLYRPNRTRMTEMRWKLMIELPQQRKHVLLQKHALLLPNGEHLNGVWPSLLPKSIRISRSQSLPFKYLKMERVTKRLSEQPLLPHRATAMHFRRRCQSHHDTTCCLPGASRLQEHQKRQVLLPLLTRLYINKPGDYSHGARTPASLLDEKKRETSSQHSSEPA